MSAAFVHPTAHVEEGAVLGDDVRVWHHAQVRPGATIGAGSILGKGAFVDLDVAVGANCKIQNYACVYHGTTLEDGVFVGPGAIFTNDHRPRAVTPDGRLKRDDDWEVGETRVCTGASVGAQAVVLPGLRIGRWALIGAGAVVRRDVPDHGLVAGNPARRIGWVCACAARLDAALACPACGRRYVQVATGLALAEGNAPAQEARHG